MATTLFTTVELFKTQLRVAGHLLDKGVEHARTSGADEATMLDWRLIEDMQPLRFQFVVVNNFAGQWPARVLGLPGPAEVAMDADVAALRVALVETATFLDGLTPEQFAELDEAPLTYQIMPGMEPTMPAGRWLTGFAATNLYFHLSMAYAILRARGAPLGKADLFAGGL